MKKIILKVILASMLLSTWAQAASRHDCKAKTDDVLKIAQRYMPAAKLQDSDAQTLLMITSQQTPGGIEMPQSGLDRKAFLMAGWLIQQKQVNIFAAHAVIKAARSGNKVMYHAAEALEIAYSPVSDEEEEHGTLAQNLGSLYQKDLAAKKALGSLIEEPGVELFIKSQIYNEPITEKIALDLMCNSSDPAIFDKADKIKQKIRTK